MCECAHALWLCDVYCVMHNCTVCGYDGYERVSVQCVLCDVWSVMSSVCMYMWSVSARIWVACAVVGPARWSWRCAAECRWRIFHICGPNETFKSITWG